MPAVIQTILPAFALILLGFLSGRFGWLPVAARQVLPQFVVRFCIPLLLFRSLAVMQWPEASPWKLWMAYFGGAFAVWALAVWLARRYFASDARRSAIAGVGSAFANTVLIGIPLVLSAFGEEGLTVLLLLVSVHLPLLALVISVQMGRAQVADGLVASGTWQRGVIETARSLLGNPIFVGIIAGGLWHLSGWPLPWLVDSVTGSFGRIAGPLALYALGLSLTGYGLRGEQKLPLLLLGLKLLVMPLIVFLLARYVLQLPLLWQQVLTLTAACPAGVNVYLFAEQFNSGQRLASSVVAAGTALSALTLSLVLALLLML